MSIDIHNWLQCLPIKEPTKIYNMYRDNIQSYMRQHDLQIGHQNQMIKGFADTAIELEDFDSTAFDLKALLECQARMEWKGLTIDTIIGNIDFGYFMNIAVGQFLCMLVNFVSVLSCYQRDIEKFCNCL